MRRMGVVIVLAVTAVVAWLAWPKSQALAKLTREEVAEAQAVEAACAARPPMAAERIAVLPEIDRIKEGRRAADCRTASAMLRQSGY